MVFSLFFFALAAITRRTVTVHGLNPETVQGDRRFIHILRKMGCSVDIGANWVTVRGRTLTGLELDMKHMPDLVCPLAVIAPFAKGRTVIRGVPHLRLKESDRIKALTRELLKVGVEVRERSDGLEIRGGTRPHGATVCSWGDHRIAMAFAVMGLAVSGITIEGAHCVDKSNPFFWTEVERLTE